MTALAPTANVGKEYVCSEVVAYVICNPESSHFAFFFLPLKLTINKVGGSLWLFSLICFILMAML